MIQVRTHTLDSALALHEFLMQTPDALLYHSPAYLHQLQTYLNASVFLHVAESEAGTWLGYWPVLISQTGTFGPVANALPYYGSNGAPVLATNLNESERAAVLEKLRDAVCATVEENKCCAFTVVTNPLDTFTANWLQENFTHDLTDDRIGQLTPLPPHEETSPEKLIQSFDDPRPRNIRKALKEGVTVRWSNDASDRDFLYNVHRENITAIGGIAKEKRFFDLLPEHFSNEQYRIYIAEKDGERIAGLLLFYYNKTVEYFTPGVVEAHRNTQPTALLVYQAMLDAIENKFQWWNWGGTWLSQGGVYDFKKKWGTRDLPYRYFTRVYNRAVLETTKDVLLRDYPNFYVVPFGSLKSV